VLEQLDDNIFVSFQVLCHICSIWREHRADVPVIIFEGGASYQWIAVSWGTMDIAAIRETTISFE